MIPLIVLSLFLFGFAIVPARGQSSDSTTRIERVETPQGEVTIVRPAPRPRPAPAPQPPVVIQQQVPVPAPPPSVLIVTPPPVIVDRGGPFVIRRPAPPNITGNPVPPLVSNPARPPSTIVRQRSNEIIVIEDVPSGTAGPNYLAPPRRR